jgi:hypothetical protein
MIGYIQSNKATSGIGPMCQTSDTALVQSIANGDNAALKLLYLRHRERVYRFVVRG